jgi:hypothetical protein
MHLFFFRRLLGLWVGRVVGSWFLLFLLVRRGGSRSLGLVLIGAAFDAELAVRITSQAFGFVIALGDVDALIIFFDPGVNRLDIEGDGFAQAGNLGL